MLRMDPFGPRFSKIQCWWFGSRSYRSTWYRGCRGTVKVKFCAFCQRMWWFKKSFLLRFWQLQELVIFVSLARTWMIKASWWLVTPKWRCRGSMAVEWVASHICIRFWKFVIFWEVWLRFMWNFAQETLIPLLIFWLKKELAVKKMCWIGAWVDCGMGCGIFKVLLLFLLFLFLLVYALLLFFGGVLSSPVVVICCVPVGFWIKFNFQKKKKLSKTPI